MYRQLRPDELWKPALLMAVVLVWVIVQAHPWIVLVVAAPFALYGLFRVLTRGRRQRWRERRLAAMKLEYEIRHGRSYPYGDRFYRSE